MNYNSKALAFKNAYNNYTINNDNDECLYYTGIKNKPFKILIKPHVKYYLFDDLKKYFDSNQIDSKNNPITYIMTIKKTNSKQIPDIKGIVTRNKSKKNFIEIIETPLLYENYLKTYLEIKRNKNFFYELSSELKFYDKMYMNKVYWNFIIEKYNFYLGPNPEKVFPLNLPNYEFDIFPWQYVCICKDTSISNIRELNENHLNILDKLETEIKNLLIKRFQMKKNNIIISVRHNISSDFGYLCFNINYIDNYNNYSKLKWEDESDILLDNLKNLLKENRIKKHIFFYGCHVKHTFFIPDAYFNEVDKYLKIESSIENIDEKIKNELKEYQIKNYLQENFKNNINIYSKNKLFGGSLVSKNSCKYSISFEGTNNVFTPPKIDLGLIKELFSNHENNILLNQNIIHLFGGYYLFFLNKSYLKKEVGSKLVDKYKWVESNELKYKHTALSKKNIIPSSILDGSNEWIKEIRNEFPNYKIIDTDNSNKKYSNFLIKLNLKSSSDNFDLKKAKNINGDIDYNEYLENNEIIKFVGWYNNNDTSKEELNSVQDFNDKFIAEEKDFIDWISNQRYYIVKNIRKLFNDNLNEKLFIKILFHYPNYKEYMLLHVRIIVCKNKSIFYNKTIKTNYSQRNKYLNDIIENKFVNLSSKYFTKETRYDYFSTIQKGGSSKEKIDLWLKNYNSEKIFYGVIDKYIKINLKINSSFKYDDKYLQFLKESKKKIHLKIKNEYNFDLLKNKLKVNSRVEFLIKYYFSKFDINLNKKILVIRHKNINFNHKNLKVVQSIDELKRTNEKFDLIIIDYRNYENDIIGRDNYNLHQLKYYIKFITLSIDKLNKNGVLSINMGLLLEKSLLDIVLLLNSFSSMFIFSDYQLHKLQDIPIFYTFSEFWKIDELKNKLNIILKNFNFNTNTRILDDSNINKDTISRMLKPSYFLIERYIKLVELIDNDILNENDNKYINNYLLESIINFQLEVEPENIPMITRMLSSKLFYLPNGQALKLHSNINMNEGNYLFNLVVENKMIRLLEVGFAYGVSAIFMTKGLENNKLKNDKEKYQLVSIDPFQSTQWHNLGLSNLKKIGTLELHKLYEQKSLNALPFLLKEKKKQYDLIFIDGWHTFDYALVDLFYATFLIRQNGYLILDDALHPGVNKLIKYIDTNYSGFLKKITNGPKTFGVYVKEGDDKRQWNYHVDF
jgi:predicted O-methyltransferase YrrM